MAEKEIIEDMGGMPFQKIDCNHCNGTGKCHCFHCISITLDVTAYDYQRYYYGKGITVNCTRCNGFGFLLLDKKGNIIVPKIKEEDDEEE